MNVERRHFIVSVLILVISILAVFLFPATTGPFSSVNGPVTVFRAARKATQIQREIAQIGLAGGPLTAATFSARFSCLIPPALVPLPLQVKPISLRC
jgi:hypothetical protein